VKGMVGERELFPARNDWRETPMVSVPLDDAIGFYNPLTITWYYGPTADGPWYEAGQSSNQVYVLLGAPQTSPLYHTLVHLSCKNAKGETEPAEATEKMWSEFTDQKVFRMDGTQLTYYSSYTTQNTTTGDLLKYGDGQCGAWASFFIDMRKIHGIDDYGEYVIFRAIPPAGIAQDSVGFIVNDWKFDGSGRSGHPVYPYLNIPDTSLIEEHRYHWKFSEVHDETGVAGQGNANPASLFNNHQVVISGEYYDPSYGKKYLSLEEIDDTAIAGFYIRGLYEVAESVIQMDLNSDYDWADIVTVPVFLFRKNTEGLDLYEERWDY